MSVLERFKNGFFMSMFERKIIEIHCDESGHELLTSEAKNQNRRYLGIGAIQIF